MGHWRQHLREHLVISAVFLVSRAALIWSGVRFDFSLDWMWLSDPADLRDRLLETLYYYHAFPPGMDLMTGILLKLAGSQAATLAHATFAALGLVILNSLFHLLRAVGVSPRVAMGVAVAYSLIPQSIYFEQLYLYEYPVAALLCLAAVFLVKAVRGQSFPAWVAFFLACALVGLTRSTFHLVWLVAMVILAAAFTEPSGRRRVLTAASGPAVLLLALYLKNFALFGLFDAFSFGPVSQALVTTWNLPDDVRNSWIEHGTLSPFAAVNVYAGPRDYLSYFDVTSRADWPSQLTALDRPSVNAPNYNHWLFLEVNRRRRADALYYVRARPLEYAGTVLEGAKDMFAPSTEWHPLDKAGGSPHDRPRQVLGRYEAFYTRLVHGFPVAPVGLYAFFPLVALWTFVHARSLMRTGDPDDAAGAVLLFWCLFQILFVVAASSLFTFRESARYRFQIEWMIWLLTTLCLTTLWRSRVRATADAHRRAEMLPFAGARFDVGQVRAYYDRHTPAFVTFGQGRGLGAIHRAVWGPGVRDRTAAFHFVEDRIAELITQLPRASEPPIVIDLGCGVGASLRYLAERMSLRGIGITVSPVQAQLAARSIHEARLSGSVVCLEGDYCDLPAGLGPADVAYAIESFAHGPAPARFFEQCSRLVRAGGLLVVCDDFRGTGGGPAAERTIDEFRQGWHINTVLEPEDLRTLARAHGFELASMVDLSPYLELRRPRDRAISVFLTLFGWLAGGNEYIRHLRGGRALQTCLARGWIRYELAVFRRTSR
jgi:SAM-dependent methyltransferase